MSTPGRPVVHCIQHSDRVRPLTVAEWAAERDVDLRVVRIDEQRALPPAPLVERVIVLGGQMNTDQSDEHPWLGLERDWLRLVIEQGRARVLGICLGSQLIAEALGGRVDRARVPEVGWQRIVRTDAGADDPLFSQLPDSFDAMQWHFDAWSLPPGATLTATSDGCTTQAFSFGDRVHGLQFHPEFTWERIRELVASTTDELPVGGWIQSPDEFLADPERFTRMRALCMQLLDAALLAPVPARA
jgi:GMP synthase-like glutamine amidotransferase